MLQSALLPYIIVIKVAPRARACTETGEVRINSSKLREEHIGIWKNGGIFL